MTENVKGNGECMCHVVNAHGYDKETLKIDGQLWIRQKLLECTKHQNNLPLSQQFFECLKSFDCLEEILK